MSLEEIYVKTKINRPHSGQNIYPYLFRVCLRIDRLNLVWQADIFGNKRHDPVKGIIIKDNYMLSQRDYILGTVSTFCSWAAFWGNKPLL
jgi:hypothetical protein